MKSKDKGVTRGEARERRGECIEVQHDVAALEAGEVVDETYVTGSENFLLGNVGNSHDRMQPCTKRIECSRGLNASQANIPRERVWCVPIHMNKETFVHVDWGRLSELLFNVN